MKKTMIKKIVPVFLIIVLGITFFVIKDVLAAQVAPTSLTTIVTTTARIRLSWSSGVGDSGLAWSLGRSTNGVTLTPVALITPTSTKTYLFDGLATNTAYYLVVGSGDNTGATTTATSSLTYTAAEAGSQPSAGAATVSTLTITVAPGGNPAATTYAIYNTTTAKFLDTDGAESDTPAWKTATAWASVPATGLTANTAYQFVVVPKNGDGVTAATSTASTAVYTLANVPVASLAPAANGFNLTWTGDANNQYYAEDESIGTDSGWISGTTFSVGGINCGTTHTFRVKARNTNGDITGWSSELTATTDACGVPIVSGGSSSGMVVPTAPTTPVVPVVTVPLSQTAAPVVVTPAPISSAYTFTKYLTVGYKSTEVKMLQAKLRELGYFTYPTNTGFFGSLTKAAVVKFQKANGLKPYPGYVGPGTRAALNNI